MKKNERLAALKVLHAVWQDGLSLSQQAHFAELSALSKNLCFGVCRYYFRLAAMADVFLDKRPKSSEVWLNLLMGLYQLHDLRIPDHAAVHETVAVLDALKMPWAKKLSNAVLRRYCRERETAFVAACSKDEFMFAHPSWLITRIKDAWPMDWQAILNANNTHPPMSLRINAQRANREDYQQRLEAQGRSSKCLSFSSQGLSLDTACKVDELPGFSQGEVSVQDEAAQLAVSLLDLKPHLRVLDACAAPGGKTAHILETEPQLAICLALDIEAKRLTRVQENLHRLHLQTPIQCGSALEPKAWWDGQLFDRILLDAPCSASGVIRRHPDIKLLRRETDVSKIAALQAQLLQTLWPLLAEGGRLVYATCSVLPEENEEQILKFLETHKDAEWIDEPKSWGRATGHGWQILPGDHNMDGFFYSVLKKMPHESSLSPPTD